MAIWASDAAVYVGKGKDGKLVEADMVYRRYEGLSGVYYFSLARFSLAGIRRSAPCAARAACGTAGTALWRYTARVKEVSVFSIKTCAAMLRCYVKIQAE